MKKTISDDLANSVAALKSFSLRLDIPQPGAYSIEMDFPSHKE